MPKSLIFLTSNSLVFLNSHNPKAIVDFPPVVIKDFKILDKHKFEQLLASFIDNLHLRPQKIILVLSDQVVFSKQSETTPIPIAEIATKQLQTPTGSYLYATNKRFFLSFIEILNRLDWKVTAVIPSILSTQEIENTQHPPKQIIKILSRADILDNLNFLDNKTEMFNTTKPINRYLRFLPKLGWRKSS